MRFLLLIKADADTEAGVLPSKELFAAMAQFNEEMADAGVLLSGEGLHPTSKGARVHFSNGTRSVIHGPFHGDNLIAGYWQIQANSLDEAIAWAKRAPDPMGEGRSAEIEIRPIYESADFPADLFPPELAAREEALRAQLNRPEAHT